MSHFVEILDHPQLSKTERDLIGMKGRVLVRDELGGLTSLYLTDKREVVVPDVALRPIPKKHF